MRTNSGIMKQTKLNNNYKLILMVANDFNEWRQQPPTNCINWMRRSLFKIICIDASSTCFII